MRYLGVDPGGKRIGLAIGDDDTGLVSPLGVVACSGARAAAELIIAAARRHRTDRVVVGLPTRPDGSETAACRRSHAIAAAVQAHGHDVVFQPELLSSNEARRRARQAGLPASRPVDDLAALIILEDHLGEQAGRSK